MEGALGEAFSDQRSAFSPQLLMLGQAKTADLEVLLPSGLVQRFGGVTADRIVTITEGKVL